MTIAERSVIGPSMGRENLEAGFRGVRRLRAGGGIHAAVLPIVRSGCQCGPDYEHSADLLSYVADRSR